MAEVYDTVFEQAENELVEKRSRFIAAIRPVKNEEEIRAFLAERRGSLPGASHYCYAYILKESSRERYSDDGEPHGTAGPPILEVIRREGVLDVMIVVTRYFGGTLLGAGGLTRAYTNAAKLALDASKRVTMSMCATFMLVCPYHLYERARILLEARGAIALGTDFGADITISARIRADFMGTLENELAELSGGRAGITVTGEEFAPV